jgi:ABC transporter substrate binding protein
VAGLTDSGLLQATNLLGPGAISDVILTFLGWERFEELRRGTSSRRSSSRWKQHTKGSARLPPVGSGLVASLARPGGNVTGSTTSERELAVKAVDWVHAAVPKATRVAVLMSNNPTHPSLPKDIQDAVKRTGLTVLPTLANSFEDFGGGI